MFGPLAKNYRGIALHAYAEPGDVQFVFHTYHGFLAFFVQTTHNVTCPADDARRLLRRLHYFNLTWGILCPGFVFIPILSFFNYLSQKRSIARQQAQQQSSP